MLPRDFNNILLLRCSNPKSPLRLYAFIVVVIAYERAGFASAGLQGLMRLKRARDIPSIRRVSDGRTELKVARLAYAALFRVQISCWVRARPDGLSEKSVSFARRWLGKTGPRELLANPSPFVTVRLPDARVLTKRFNSQNNPTILVARGSRLRLGRKKKK